MEGWAHAHAPKEARVADRFTDGLLTPKETASYLEIPQSTLTSWLHGTAAGTPLVHQAEPPRKGQPSVPFIAVAEAHVLRSLRTLGLRMSEIRDAAAGARRTAPRTAWCPGGSPRTAWTSSWNTASGTCAGPATARPRSTRSSPTTCAT
ncbi:hypothetical protein [Streptomyces sp. SPB074]|uniref:hypothetical protein n=1 Tax=Streptomyces sp. (strain SPB074) TaxID=465543 RepID=UPI002D21B7B4|nr:hypothetical protein [Streptomyces sp. SPB074]